MNLNLYFLPFILSFLISVILTAFLVWLSKKIPALKKRKISRLGGLAIIFSFALAIFFDPHLFIARELWAIFISQQFRRFIPAVLPEWLKEAYCGDRKLEEVVKESKKMLGDRF